MDLDNAYERLSRVQSDNVKDKYIKLLEDKIDNITNEMVEMNGGSSIRMLESEVADLEGEVVDLKRELQRTNEDAAVISMVEKDETIEQLREEVQEVKRELRAAKTFEPKSLNDSIRDSEVITIKKYDLDDDRYGNIMSHMNILWCDDEGWDGCGKCTGYRDIIMSALDKIESMSSRRIDKDFASKHISGDPKYDVENNTNCVTYFGGGDKDRDEYVDNCIKKREYR